MRGSSIVIFGAALSAMTCAESQPAAPPPATAAAAPAAPPPRPPLARRGPHADAGRAAR